MSVSTRLNNAVRELRSVTRIEAGVAEGYEEINLGACGYQPARVAFWMSTGRKRLFLDR